jgi:Tfp pilus assembly protein FimT
MGTSLRRAGFTLVELVVVFGLLTMVLALGLFISLDVYRGFGNRSERATIAALLARARSHAIANVGESPWGVCEDTSAKTYALFRGAGYAAGAYVDETVPASGAATVTGMPPCAAGQGIVFAQLSGTTTATTTVVKEGAGPDSVISINDLGTIIW